MNGTLGANERNPARPANSIPNASAPDPNTQQNRSDAFNSARSSSLEHWKYIVVIALSKESRNTILRRLPTAVAIASVP
jgi:hypothetical protein